MNAVTILQSPRFWICFQLLVIMIVGSVFGCWHVQMSADSWSYISTSTMAADLALRQPRTLGYPIILRVVAAISPDYQALPWVQMAMLWPAVLLLDFAMRRFGASSWQAFVVSSGFMYGAIQQLWTIASVLSDFPATLAAGMTIACLFLIIANPSHLGGWLGLTFLLTAAYHIRPAYLFLVPLVPCLGVVLLLLRRKEQPESCVWKRLLPAILVVSISPFLAFCVWRWKIVGDFALVSFGGWNSTGLAAELIDAKMIENELAERFRPFAREILKGREERSMRQAFSDGWWVDMRAYEDNYCVSIFLIAAPAARRHFGENLIVQNREMAHFSREVIGRRKGKFLLWAVEYWPRAVMKVAYRYWILQAAIPMTIVSFAIRRFRRRNGDRFCRYVLRPNCTRASILPALLWLNILYFGASISVLIVAGSYADSRLVVPTAIFLPSLVGLLMLREWRLWSSAASSL